MKFSEEIESIRGFLAEKKYDVLIQNFNELDEILKTQLENKFQIGLAKCRMILEAFFKIFLLDHNIKELKKGIKTEEGTVHPLAETIKKKIKDLFTFPLYSKNLETGLFHLIESSKFMVSGFANSGGIHGKPESPYINPKDLYVSISFIITLIKIFLSYEITIKKQVDSLSDNERIILEYLQQNRKDYTINDIKNKLKGLSEQKIKVILESLVYLNLAWKPGEHSFRITDLGKGLLNETKTAINGEFLIGMTLQFGDSSVKIIDMFKQKYADYYRYEISIHGIKTFSGVHVHSRTKRELIEKIKKKLEGKDLF